MAECRYLFCEEYNRSVINEFIGLVEKKAEFKMRITGKLEGSHYAAMKELQKEMNECPNKSKSN